MHSTLELWQDRRYIQPVTIRSSIRFRTRWALRALGYLLAALLLGEAAGCEEPQLGELTIIVRDPPYPRPRCARGPKSLGLLYPRGRPVKDAAVALTPSKLVAKTGSDGRAKLESVPYGKYTLTVGARAHRTTHREVNVSGEHTIEVQLGHCIDAGSDQYGVGFSTIVSLSATNRCGSIWAKAKYRWRQLEGPDVSDSVKSWHGKQITFETAAISDLRAIPSQPQLISFSPEQAGQYVFEVTATHPNGVTSSSTLMVTAAHVTGGVTSVPPRATYYFAGKTKGPWKWRVVKKQPGWEVTIRPKDKRVAGVTIEPASSVDVPRTVIVSDGELRFSLMVGGWDLVRRDCGRSNCHMAMERNWKHTKHSSTWKRLIDGEQFTPRAPVAESCATCHALGYNPGAKNGGYDDLAKKFGAHVPLTPQRGAFDDLPKQVRQVSNVYCLACHGSARVDPPFGDQPGLFGAGVCARCHDRPPELTTASEWRTSKHAKTITGEINGPETRRPCSSCHTAQGFYREHFALARPASSKTVTFNCCLNPQPITCQGCHNAMLAKHPHQLHDSDAVKTPSGLDLDDVGNGAVCARCHNAGADLHNESTVRDRLAPHAPQADLLYGKAGFSLVAPQSYPELSGVACGGETKQGCVSCHMAAPPRRDLRPADRIGGHTFRMRSDKAGENLAVCRSCHPGMKSFDHKAKGDYDGDGDVEGAKSEVRGLLALLAERLREAISARGYRGCDRARSRGVWIDSGEQRGRIVVVDAKGIDLGDCDRNGAIERAERAFVFPEGDLALYRAAYNYLVVARDGSAGLHNFPYTVKLLQRTIHAVGGGKNVPSWTLRR